VSAFGQGEWLIEQISDSNPTLSATINHYNLLALEGSLLQGEAGNDTLIGTDGVDHFDGNAGGNDILRGKIGKDVYWLGSDTGTDKIEEGSSNSVGDNGDAIRLKPGLTASDVRLTRDGSHLHVSLVDSEGTVTDEYKVSYHFSFANYRVESVELSDGTEVLGLDDFALARMHGTSRNDTLTGLSDVADHFDADAGGNDTLRGKSGNDVYWLGADAGADKIEEGSGNSSGDTGDVIRVEDGYGIEDVELMRDGSHLIVRLLDDSGAVDGSLSVQYHFSHANYRVESIEVGGRSFDTSQAEAYIAAIADYRDEETESEYATLQALTDDYWA